MPSVRTRTKRPRGALLQLRIVVGSNMCRIVGRLLSRYASICGVVLGIPLCSYWGSNAVPSSGQRTVSGGQFDWGGRLPKSNGGAQRFPQNGWKPFIERKSIRELDCKAYKPSRYESRI